VFHFLIRTGELTVSSLNFEPKADAAWKSWPSISTSAFDGRGDIPQTSANFRDGPELTSRDVRDAIGLGSSAFRLPAAAVSMSLAGSCFSPRTKKPMMEKMLHLLDRKPMELPMQNDACNWRRHRDG
jgi:hypothetical protein